MSEKRQLRICVVGAGMRFTSGISYYTLHLANTLARSHRVSAILMRQLLPRHLYPGRERVGVNLSNLKYDPAVRVFDGVDWYWLPSMVRALVFLIRERPDEIVFQWWSGTVLHSYLLLAFLARLLGTHIVIEFHEVLDPGEAKLRLAQSYVRLMAPLLILLAHGFVIHSEHSRTLLQKCYKLKERPVALIPHGPFDHYQSSAGERVQRCTPGSCCNLLFFGVIRPYKGLEDLIKAFDSLPEEEVGDYWLTIVGETWEGWTQPANLINQCRYRDRITFVNRYVSDMEAGQFFAAADAVVLPYRRSLTSGPLHIAMSCGLPVVVTHVGGLVEAVNDYGGAILVPPEDPGALQSAIVQVAQLRGERYPDPHSWECTAARYQQLFDALRAHSRPESAEPHSGYEMGSM